MKQNIKIHIPFKQNFPKILKFSLCFWLCSAFLYNFFKTNITENGKFLTFLNICNNEIKFDANFILIFIVCSLIVNLLIFFISKKRIVKNICFYLISILLSCCVVFLHSCQLKEKEEFLLNTKQINYICSIKEDQKESTLYNTVAAKINIENKEYDISLQLDKNFEELHFGEAVKGNIKFSKIPDKQKDYYWQNGIVGVAKIENPSKVNSQFPLNYICAIRNYIIKMIRDYDGNAKSDEEQLFSAIICGQRIDLNSGSIYDNFKNAGLAHIVAVSGAHLSLVSAILLSLLKILKFKKRNIIVIQSFFILMFLLCSGIPISALRASIMTFISIFSFFSKRRPASLNALAICIILMLCANPSTCTSISFALSAASTLGIILFSRLFEYYIKLLWLKCPNFITSALALTFASNVCSLPLSISVFNQLSLISPLSNIICTPIFTILCGFGLIAVVVSLILGSFLPFITNIAMFISFKISSIMCIIVKCLSNIPYSCIAWNLNLYQAIFISIIICLVLNIVWPKFDKKDKSKILKQVKPKIDEKQNLYVPHFKKRKKFRKKIILPVCIICIILITSFVFIKNNNSVTQLFALDVGQGDCILIKSKGQNFMVDTGNQDNILKQRLAEQGITHLNGILITHPDDDHCGSLDIIESLVEVDNFYIAKDLSTSTDSKCQKLYNQAKKISGEKNIKKLSVGNTIDLGEVTLKVVWPYKYQDNGGNCDSLCVIAYFDIKKDNIIDATALLCGDAENKEIEEMQKSKLLQNVDIYKCGHHGSKNAITENEAKLLNPKTCIISVGEKNRYGHPSNNTIDILKKNNCSIYRTDKQGTIKINFYEKKYNVETSK